MNVGKFTRIPKPESTAFWGGIPFQKHQFRDNLGWPTELHLYVLRFSPPFTGEENPNSARDRSLFNLNSKTYEESTFNEISTPKRSPDFNFENQTIGVQGTGVWLLGAMLKEIWRCSDISGAWMILDFGLLMQWWSQLGYKSIVKWMGLQLTKHDRAITGNHFLFLLAKRTTKRNKM